MVNLVDLFKTSYYHGKCSEDFVNLNRNVHHNMLYTIIIHCFYQNLNNVLAEGVITFYICPNTSLAFMCFCTTIPKWSQYTCWIERKNMKPHLWSITCMAFRLHSIAKNFFSTSTFPQPQVLIVLPSSNSRCGSNQGWRSALQNAARENTKAFRNAKLAALWGKPKTIAEQMAGTWNLGANSILGSMVSYQRVIVGLSQSAPAVGWGSPLHAWLASVNRIGCAHCLNRCYRYGAHGMYYHILLRQYSQNYYTYNSVVKNTYSPCHKDACVQISIGYTK